MKSIERAGALALVLASLSACSDPDMFTPPHALVMDAPMCYGRAATIYPGNPGNGTIIDDGLGNLTITGTAGNDVIVGGAGDDVIDGLDGNDRICALGGADVIKGGPGTTDWSDGGDGFDIIDYSASPAGVTVRLGKVGRGGDAENDRIDNMEGVIGSAFDDVLAGDAGPNLLDGGAGNDEIWPGAGADQVIGGDGVDRVSYADSPAGVTVDLFNGTGTGGDAEGDTYDGIEDVDGSTHADVLKGDAGPNRLSGRGGDDELWGGAGDDNLHGGGGNDTLHGDDDDTQLGNDILNGSDGDDILHGYGGNDRMFGGDGNDELYGGPGDDDMRGQGGVNIMDGGDGNDYAVSDSCLDTVTNAETFFTQRCVVDVTQTTVSAADATLTADGTSATTITVQLKDGDGNSLTLGAGAVELTTNAGTLSDGVTSAATLAAINHNDGTYTLDLVASNTVETATVTATLNGDPITDNATVGFTATAPTAVADAAAGTSAPGDAFHATLNTTLNVGAGSGLLANDNRGTPSANVTHFGGVQCNDGAGTLNAASGTVTSNAAGATMSLAGVTGCGSGSLTVNADGSVAYVPPTNYTGLLVFTYRIGNPGGTSDATVTLATGFRPAAGNDNYSAAHGTLIGNVSLNTATGTPFSVSTNDGGDQRSVHFVSNTSGGTFNLNADGTFTYTPTAGFTGAAAFTYNVRNGFGNVLGSVTMNVGAPRLWFTDLAVAVSGSGTQASPFKNLSDLATANAGGGGTQPQDSDVLFIAENASAYVGTLTLRAGQRLIGQDASATLASIASLTPATHQSLPGMNPGANSVNLTSAGTTLTLGSGNTIRGFTLGNATTSALTGTSFGTLTTDTDVVINNANGSALSLTTGTVSGNFGGVASAAGASNVSLTGVTGTLTLAGPFSGATTTALNVSGGSVSLNVTGNVTFAGTGALLNVAGTHTGTLDFSGVLSATAGTGLQFSAASGAYNFNTSAGSTTLNGGDAGIDIAGGSTGTFVFGRSASPGSFAVTHTNAATRAFFIDNANPTVTYRGNLSKTAASGTESWLVDIFNMTSLTTGSVLFESGTLSAAVGTGILLNNVDRTVSFNGTTTLSGTARARIGGGSIGAITFGSGTTITNPSAAPGLDIENASAGNSATNVSFAGSISSNSHRPVRISGVSSGSVTVSGNVTSTGQGIEITGNSGGTYTFSGASKSLSTGANAAFTVASSPNATVNVTGGGLAITASGGGLIASGGGTINVTGAPNTVSGSGNNAAVSINGTTIGASGITFQSVSHTGGATNGILLQNTGSSGGSFTVTGTGTVGTGGTIVNTTGGDGATTGNGIYLNGTRNVSLSWMNLSGHQNNGMFATGHRGDLTMNKMRFTGNNGTSNSGEFDESAISLVNHGGGTKITNSRIDGGAFNGLRVENIIGTAPALDSLVIENDTIESMQGSTADVRSSAILVSLMDGTADVRIRTNRVTVWWGNAIHVLIQGTASGTARITNNTADNNNGALAAAGGIWVAGCNMAFRIEGNSVRDTDGTAISADKANCAGTTFQGTIHNNTIGVSGVANSGSGTGIGIFAAGRNGTTTVNITNNTLRQINGSANGAITLVAGDNVAFPPSGTINATVSGNNIQESGTLVNNAQHGILVTHGTTSSGANDTHQGCYNILNNTIINFTSGTANNRIRVNQRFGTTSRWPGYTGAATGATSQTDMASYLLGRNTASTSQNANISTGGFLNTSPAGSACPQPSI